MPKELFEAVMDAFLRVHNVTAPLEEADGYGPEYVRRLMLFGAFVSLLGPSDVAGLLALRRLREAQP